MVRVKGPKWLSGGAQGLSGGAQWHSGGGQWLSGRVCAGLKVEGYLVQNCRISSMQTIYR